MSIFMLCGLLDSFSRFLNIFAGAFQRVTAYRDRHQQDYGKYPYIVYLHFIPSASIHFVNKCNQALIVYRFLEETRAAGL